MIDDTVASALAVRILETERAGKNSANMRAYWRSLMATPSACACGMPAELGHLSSCPEGVRALQAVLDDPRSLGVDRKPYQAPAIERTEEMPL